MELFDYLMTKKGHNLSTHGDLFSYLLGKPNQLPSEYQRIGYIEGTGTQYLDLGRKSTPNTKFDFTFTTSKKVGDEFQTFFGSQYGTTKNRVYLQFNTGGFLQIQFPHNGNDNLYPTIDGKMYTTGHENERVVIQPGVKIHYIFDIPNRSLTMNKLTCVSSSTYTLVNSDYNILFFTRNTTDGAPTTNLGTGKLYNFKWYENDELEMYLLPCIRKSDNALGMYDVVGNQFYANAGSGEFNFGGYTNLDYIVSNGNQHLNLGINGNNNTKIEIKYMKTANQNIMQICGDITNQNKAISYNLGSNSGYSRWGNSNKYGVTEIINNEIYTSIISKDGYYNNGKLWWKPNENTFTTENVMFLLNANSNSTTTKFIGRLYYCKVYQNDVLVRDLVPCYRNLDNEVGMFDNVTKTFFVNQGTGTFATPNNVQLNSIQLLNTSLLSNEEPLDLNNINEIEDNQEYDEVINNEIDS